MLKVTIIDKRRQLVIPNKYEYVKSIVFNQSGEIEYIETEFVNVTASGEPFIDNFTYELKDIELYICGKRVAS